MEFFKPSLELAKKLGDYHGPNSNVRLDFNSEHLPTPGSPPSLKEVQKTIQERILRYAGTLSRRAGVSGKTEICFSDGAVFTSEVADGIRKRLNFRLDKSEDLLLQEIAKEFHAWLKLAGGKYEDWILMRDEQVYILALQVTPTVLPLSD